MTKLSITSDATLIRDYIAWFPLKISQSAKPRIRQMKYLRQITWSLVRNSYYFKLYIPRYILWNTSFYTVSWNPVIHMVKIHESKLFLVSWNQVSAMSKSKWLSLQLLSCRLKTLNFSSRLWRTIQLKHATHGRLDWLGLSLEHIQYIYIEFR